MYADDSQIQPFIPDLMNYLPPHYRNSPLMQDIQKAIAIEIGKVRYSKEDLLNQFYIDTATWGLSSIWENPLGIQTDLNKSYEFRRSVIKAKLRGSGTINISLIKNVAESFSNGQVDVIEDNANYSFTIKFVGTLGIPPNMQDLQKSIEEIKPAHLGYKFEYTYLTWDQFDNYNKTWDEWDALNLTWDEFETYREVI